jgi:predicted permease
MKPTLEWRLVEWWLTRRVPRRSLDTVLADLEDDYREQRQMTSRGRASLWLWREAKSVARAYRRERLTGGPADHTHATRRFAHWLESVLVDLRLAVRALRTSPGFSLTVVGTLGLAIGLCASLFTVFNALALRAWPVRDPASVVVPFIQPVGTRGFSSVMPLAEFEYLRDHAQTLSGLVAWERGSTRVFTGSGPENVHVQVLGAGGSFFEVLGIGISAGRPLGPADDEPGRAVAVITHGLWRRAFGGDPAILGRTLDLGSVNRVPVTIVGITRPAFTGLGPGVNIEVLVPRGFIDQIDYPPGEKDPIARFVGVAGRLRAGVSRAQAEVELNGLDAQFRASARLEGNGLVLSGTRPIGQPGRNAATLPVFANFGAALLLVLLLACANVGNLQMARLMARRREILVRLSLGAGRWRIVRQLLTEATGVSLASAMLGFALAAVVPRLVLALAGEEEEGISLTPDATVLAFAIALAFASTVFFALAPTLRATRGGMALARSTRDGIDRRGRRLRSVLLGAQLALSLTLLTGAGLMTRGLMHLRHADLGFDVRQTAVATVSLPEQARTRTAATAAWQAIDTALEQSGLGPVGRALSQPPLSDQMFATDVRRLDESETWNRRAVDRPMTAASFAALGLAFVAGGPYGDDPATRQAVVNETLARMLFAGEAAVGRTVLAEKPVSGATFEPYVITGVVRDSHYTGPAEVLPLFHRAPDVSLRSFVIFRTDRPDAAARLRAVLLRAHPGVSVSIAPTAAQIDREIEDRVLATGLAWAVGGLGLGLATIGVFGVFACVVEERRREIGIRLALGARVPHILGAMFAATRWPVGGGVTAGLVLSAGAGFGLRSFLFGLSPLDPWAYLSVTLMLLTAAAVATFVPSRRAWRVDPTVTLRAD